MFNDIKILSIEKIEDEDVAFYMERALKASYDHNFEDALIDCDKAIKFSKEDKLLTHCLCFKSFLLYELKRDNECIEFIDEHLEMFIKELGFISRTLKLVFTYLWHSYYRQHKHMKAFTSLCDHRYLQGIICIITFALQSLFFITPVFELYLPFPIFIVMCFIVELINARILFSLLAPYKRKKHNANL